ncbi:hypothetical protein GUJ93_ZPchr0044g38093 [Zizania palustris]|uniref:Longin domain-containing protein n=1 Tax=Zizania palustris TaxID=103762 RepID=A0A8J5UV48_ZIZPA|nr:hypothetical protein GUJ93_ZPchr0044g38093 [Zizania palustris]
MKVESPGMHEAAAAGEDDGGVSFCVAVTSRGRMDRISYFQAEAGDEDDEEEARELAAFCLGHAPEHHRWHHHTVDEQRTFAFLAGDDGRTYFAVADPTPGGAETVRFLERVRDALTAAPRRHHPRDDAVAPVVRQFVQALRAAAAHQNYPMAAGSSSPGDPPLAGGDSDEEDLQRDEQPEAEGASSRRTLHSRTTPTRSWWGYYTKVVIAVDLALCLVLFFVWLIACNGFRCVQR